MKTGYNRVPRNGGLAIAVRLDLGAQPQNYRTVDKPRRHSVEKNPAYVCKFFFMPSCIYQL